MSLDIEHLRTWIGRSETRTDTATLAPLDALAATLDRDDAPAKPGDVIAPLWHWLYFLPRPRHSELGADGHARRGGFIPPVPLPRRMWAGSRLEWAAPLRAGQALTRTSRIEDVQLKEGRAGSLVFVKVRHEVHAEGQVAIVEEQDLVYRELPPPDAPAPAAVPAPAAPAWVRPMEPDDVLLFRYSALTFNGHRIHYDRHYATAVEGYPGLVVHGPLMATLLLDLLRRERPGAAVKQFSFRAVRPQFDTTAFELCGRPGTGTAGPAAVDLWVRGAQGHLVMEASALLA